jgi:hypothetical protein
MIAVPDPVIDHEIYSKFSAIDVGIWNLTFEIQAAATALSESDKVLAEARLKCLALMERKQEIAADVAILKEMLGVR